MHRLFLTAAQPAHELPTNSGGMLFACWAILIVLLAMSFVFLRSGKKEYSVAILPLLITPAANIFSGLFSRFLDKLVPLSSAELRVIIVLTSGLISCLLLGLASRKLSGEKTRLIFFWVCAAFVVILTLVLVINELVAAR
ncbi:MAG: hypothetical protein PHH84_05345 [Oscillospiraceae bacterium]|nr:hypothetical protein [Oscillospiraceae bacterium]MDD4414040.1 hypothetical protein [Oscillospiraceae bacterium]